MTISNSTNKTETKINFQSIEEKKPTPNKEKQNNFHLLLVASQKYNSSAAITGDNSGGGNQSDMIFQAMLMEMLNDINEKLEEQTVLLKNYSELPNDKNNKSITV